MSRRAVLPLILLFAAAPAFAFPGGRTFSGRVKCTTTYNEGDELPFTSTDIVTLAFVETSTDENREAGTVTLTHTETNTSGVYMTDDEPVNYIAFEPAGAGGAGLVAVQDLTELVIQQSTAVGDYKSKSDGSITSLRMVFTHADSLNGEVQHCSGTLKLVPFS